MVPRTLLVAAFALEAGMLSACGGATTGLGTQGDAGEEGSVTGADGGVTGTDGGVTAADGGVDAPAPLALTCVPDAGATASGPSDPAVPDVVSGTNGVFSDACDAQGNLVDYYCETFNVCGPGPNPSCQMYLTGRVVSQNVDCSGHCSTASCDSRCPAIGQRFHYAAVGASGAATIVNDSDGRTYACSVLYDNPNDSFSCTTGPTVGMAGTITSLGMHGSYCTGKGFGNIGVTIDGVSAPGNETCAYGCDIP
jgi:hypothetical protein